MQQRKGLQVKEDCAEETRNRTRSAAATATATEGKCLAAERRNVEIGMWAQREKKSSRRGTKAWA